MKVKNIIFSYFKYTTFMGNSGYKYQSVDIPERSPLFGHRMERTKNIIQENRYLNEYYSNPNNSYFLCCAERDNSTNTSKNKLREFILHGENI